MEQGKEEPDKRTDRESKNERWPWSINRGDVMRLDGREIDLRDALERECAHPVAEQREAPLWFRSTKNRDASTGPHYGSDQQKIGAQVLGPTMVQIN